MKTVPFEYEKYLPVSEEIYKIFFSYADEIQAISCDEACIDVTSKISIPFERENILELAREIRMKILDATRCNASIGISHNMLLARMASKCAKPNGQFYLEKDKVANFLGARPVSSLPGIGYSHESVLEMMNVKTCSQLQKVSLEDLKEAFGDKIGLKYYNYSRLVFFSLNTF